MTCQPTTYTVSRLVNYSFINWTWFFKAKSMLLAKSQIYYVQQVKYHYCYWSMYTLGTKTGKQVFDIDWRTNRLKPHQNFFQNFFSTNMVARGVQSFCILEGTTDLLIEQWLKFLCQFTPDIWWTNAENFKSISWVVSGLLSFNWKILVVVCLHAYKLAFLLA